MPLSLVAIASRKAVDYIIARKEAGYVTYVPAHIKEAICRHVSAVHQASWLGHGYSRSKLHIMVAIAVCRPDRDPLRPEILVTIIRPCVQFQCKNRPVPTWDGIMKDTYLGTKLIKSCRYKCAEFSTTSGMLAALSSTELVNYANTIRTTGAVNAEGAQLGNVIGGRSGSRPGDLTMHVTKGSVSYSLEYRLGGKPHGFGVDMSRGHHTYTRYYGNYYVQVCRNTTLGRYRAVHTTNSWGNYCGRYRVWNAHGHMFDDHSHEDYPIRFDTHWRHGQLTDLSCVLGGGIVPLFRKPSPLLKTRPIVVPAFDDKFRCLPREYWYVFEQKIAAEYALMS